MTNQELLKEIESWSRKSIKNHFTEQLNIHDISGSCSCGVKYVETKRSDIPYDTNDNVYYTDIMIYHCPKCGNIDRIEEY